MQDVVQDVACDIKCELEYDKCMNKKYVECSLLNFNNLTSC